MVCTHKTMVTAQENEKASLQKAVDKLDTPIEVRVLLMLGINHGLKQNELSCDEIMQLDHHTWGRELLKAVHKQDIMG